ncbi:1684_t:CDS:2, partial [Scutellospora calospora]
MGNDFEYHNDFNNFNHKIAESLGTSFENFSFAITKPSIQTTFNFSIPSESKNKEPENKRIYKCKKLLFTQEYFEKIVNDKGKNIQVCKIVNENSQKCGKEYKNIGSSTGNLIIHLQDSYRI